MNLSKKAIILINIGSPNTYNTKDVRKYLKQFLTDKRVISIPSVLRYLLVYGIIAPFRAPKSAQKYKEIWTENGSPLIYHSNMLKSKLKTLFNDKYDVYFAMRYGKPSIHQILNDIKAKNYSQLVVCPVYPQNASSTTTSSVEEFMRVIKTWENLPHLKFVNEFWNNLHYIEALATRVSEFSPSRFDHVVISFHGLPLSQVYEAHKGYTCSDLDCVNEISTENKYCYQAQCYGTANALAQRLQLNSDTYSVAFQSRLSKNWLSPFTDDLLIKLINHGKKKVMVICPSFISDCLETIHEIEIEYSEIFKKNGGEELFLVPALNSCDYWVEAFSKVIEN